MKRVIFVLSVVTLIGCNNKKESYTIIGKTSGLADSTKVYLAKENEDFDSTLIINDKFRFSEKVEGDYSNIWIHTKNYKEYKSLWVVNNDITFDASNSSFRDAVVTGSRIQDQSNEYQSLTSSLDMKMDSIRTLARSAHDSVRKELRKECDQLSNRKNKLEIDFIRDHPNYELSAFFLIFLKNDIDKNITSELYEGFIDKVKNSEWGKTISLHLEKSVNLDVGDKAVDFELSKINGEKVSLSDFEGKYVLLEFWATGCAPCRWENPNLLKAYKKYNTKGFEILGVSLDEKATHWESTVKKDSIIWTTVGDLKGMSGEVPITYSVNYIPKNYLLNEEGLVISKDLRGENLQEKLKEIFGG